MANGLDTSRWGVEETEVGLRSCKEGEVTIEQLYFNVFHTGIV